MSAVYFAQIREDGRLERTAAAAAGSKRIVTIASGGCTALSLLTDDVEVVHAVDLNPAQCAVVALRRAALVALDRDAFLAFIGEAPSRDRGATYVRLEERLPADVRAFWDAHPDDVARGINHCGVTERFYRFVGERLLDAVALPVWRRLVDSRGIDEQRALYRRHFLEPDWRDALRDVLSRDSHLRFFPAFMFGEVREGFEFGDYFADRFEAEVETRPLAGNYFLSQLLFGRYVDRPGGMPHYLTPAGFAEAKRNADKLRVACGTLREALPALGRIDAFFLSNVFDWADVEARQAICAAVAKAATPGATLLFRNMLAAPPLPADFGFAADADRSAALTRLERAMLYRAVTVGQIQ